MTLEAIRSAAGHVAREWGEYGYRVERAEQGPTRGAATLHIVHSDGSRFSVTADAYGNILDPNGTNR